VESRGRALAVSAPDVPGWLRARSPVILPVVARSVRSGACRDARLFKLEHMLKDVRLCLEEDQALGVPFPSAAHTREVLMAAMGMGHADDDFAAMIEPLQNAAGTKL